MNTFHMLYFLVFFTVLFNQEVFCYPSDVSQGNSIIKPLGGIEDVVTNTIKNFFKAKTPVSDFPDSGRTQAVLELQSKESLPIQLDYKYAGLQGLVAGIFNPKPVVDVTEEHEKYGNDGGAGRKVATVVVGGFEGLSNGLNAAADFPFVAAKEFGKKITTSLNIVGGKLVGLS